MHLLGDDRAQSVVIGSLLIFTILILAFSGYQAFAVPNQNAQVEADHFQDVEAQFSELRSNIINSIGTDDTRSTTIDLGTRYPSRTFALNPPPAAGRLKTTEAGNVSVTEDGTKVDVCAPDGTTPTTRSLVYTPNYNEYQPPRAVGYENRMISREFQDGTLFDQRMVNSNTNTISLYLFTGSVSENGLRTYTLEVNGSRQFTTTLNDPTITVPSEYGATTWNEDILVGQDVTADNAGNGRVELDFSADDWEVSCAVVGLDSEPEFTPQAADASATETKDGIYEVQWDVQKIITENDNVRASDTADIEVNTGATVENPGMFVDVTNRTSDEPVDGIEIDAGHDGIATDIEDSNIVTGEDGVAGETPGFTVEFASNPGTGFLYAGAGDDVDSMSVEVVGAVFESLEGTTSTQGGQSNPADATFDFSISSTNEVTFTATEINGDNGQEVVTTDSGEVTVSIPSSGNNAYPVTLEAQITNGECLETVITDETDTATLSNGDWVECAL